MSDGRHILGRKALVACLSAFWCVAGVFFLLGPINVGFLSDDYDLISRAALTPSLRALEAHHWAPFLTLIFRATHAGTVGRWTWISIAYAAHCANIAMVWCILILRLRASVLVACIATVLFTVCCAGFEALAWSCALGYVLTTTIILLGLLLLLSLDRDFSASSAVGLAALQIVALVIWDWGILFSPMMALCFAARDIRPGNISSVFRRGVILLWPSFGCWSLVLAAKVAFLGQPLGYSVSFSLARSAYFLVTAPLRCIYPNGSTLFYKSALGLSVSLCMLALLMVGSLRDRRIGAACAMFLLCQIPYAFLGAPESRYFYVACPFLYTSIALSMSYVPGHRTRLAMALALVTMSTVWGVHRAALWRGAYREAQRIKTEIELRTQDQPAPTVVVNLPDRYGPENLMWRPYVWRNGLSAFKEEIIRVNTPGVPFVWDASGIPVMTRENVFRKYSGHRLIEVKYAEPRVWKHFAVGDFIERLDGAPDDRLTDRE